MKTIHAVYTKFIVYVAGGEDVREPSRHAAEGIHQRVSALKHATVNVSKEHCDKGLFTLKLHQIYHIHGDISRYGSLNYIDANAFEHFNVKISNSIHTTSMHHATRMGETVRNMDPVLKKTRGYMDNGKP